MKDKKRKLQISGNALVLVIAIVLIVAIFSSINKNFFSYANLINVLVSSVSIGLTAIGMTFLIMIGGVDLSAGAVAAMSGVFIAWALQATSSQRTALALLTLVGAAVAGLLNALMVIRLRIVPFIATLASQFVWQGAAYLICKGTPIPVKDAGLQAFAKGRIFGNNGIPWIVIMALVFFLIFSYVLTKTKFGRSVFAIGGNGEAARLAGINSNRVKVICYVMTSAFAGLAGIILSGRMNAGNPAANESLQFDAIIAANLAGVSMEGGVGSIPAVILGVCLVQAFNSGLNMAQISPYWQFVARGMLLLASLSIDFFRQRARERKLLADSMRNL